MSHKFFNKNASGLPQLGSWDSLTKVAHHMWHISSDGDGPVAVRSRPEDIQLEDNNPYRKDIEPGQFVTVCLGGHRFNASVISIDGDTVRLLTSSGEIELGLNLVSK